MIKPLLKHFLRMVVAFVIVAIIFYIMIFAHVDQVFFGIKPCFYSVSILAILYTIYVLIKNSGFKNFFIILICYLIFAWIVPMKPVYDEYDCISYAICAEGLEINTEYGLIKVNKENCLKYNWKWDEKSKTCNMKD